MTRPRSLRVAHAFVWAASLQAFAVATPEVLARDAPVWVRVELVENTVEGPGFDRCQFEATLEKTRAAHGRVFYGEAHAGSSSGWSAIRSASGCAQVESERAVSPWTLRGSPYFLADLTVGPASASGGEILLDAAFSVRTLTGFAPDGAPAYETRTEKRKVRVPEGGSAVIPILIAGDREKDELRVRELFLRFRASAVGARPPVEYGEIAVSSDMPRAEIFLDGGFVGRTSADGPFVLNAVRVGTRQVIVQDASGREARAVTRVEKGRRASVTLSLRKDAIASARGLSPLGRNPQGGEEFWREKDGAIVVHIPGGEFPMGSPETVGDPSERPRHLVRVQGFLMDKAEVTWGQYKRYLEATSKPAPKSPIWGTPEAFPASFVTWNEADAFCAWAGGRLPTEAEWERAARGDDSREYPWGNHWDEWRCNTRDGGPHAPTPAAANPDCVGPYGVLDLVGSVSEWCADWYADSYDAKGPAENPTGPETGTRRATRGGAWMSAAPSVRGAARLGIEPAWADPMLGFRCAKSDGEADRK